eukprot:scaffold19505_cov96-Isochrysis_galbana.AAC.2
MAHSQSGEGGPDASPAEGSIRRRQLIRRPSTGGCFWHAGLRRRRREGGPAAAAARPGRAGRAIRWSLPASSRQGGS